MRGLIADALADARNAAAVARLRNLPPQAPDLYRTATLTYRSIAAAYQNALAGELARNLLLERRMRGAGLQVRQPGPAARWRTLWTPTICTADHLNRVQQRVLGPTPMLGVTEGRSHWRRDPRPDLAPPLRPPARTLQVYLGSAVSPGGNAAWSLVVVSGGDGFADLTATHILEAAGPLETDRQTDRWNGAHDPTAEAATLAAAIEALATLDHGPHSTAPLTLRAPIPHALAVGGMGEPATDELYRRFRIAWRASAAARNGGLWLGGARPMSDQPWVDRAHALAQLCLHPLHAETPTRPSIPPELGPFVCVR